MRYEDENLCLQVRDARAESATQTADSSSSRDHLVTFENCAAALEIEGQSPVALEFENLSPQGKGYILAVLQSRRRVLGSFGTLGVAALAGCSLLYGDATLSSLASTQSTKITADESGQYFSAMAMSSDGSTAIIASEGGPVYVFSEAEGSWTQEAKLTPDDGDGLVSFRTFVAISGDGSTAIIGARRGEDPNGKSRFSNPRGSAYVFK